MTEQEVLQAVLIFLAGLVVGVIATLLMNKIRSGSASPVKIKKEMEDYQAQVEAHFEQTSEKFKNMADQYQDLYKHLSVGATTLCRPENIVPGLADGSSPLSKNVAIESKPKTKEAAVEQKTSKPVVKAKTGTPKANVSKAAKTEKVTVKKPVQKKTNNTPTTK